MCGRLMPAIRDTRALARELGRARACVSARINAAIGAVGMSERSAWHERRAPATRG